MDRRSAFEGPARLGNIHSQIATFSPHATKSEVQSLPGYNGCRSLVLSLVEN